MVDIKRLLRYALVIVFGLLAPVVFAQEQEGAQSEQTEPVQQEQQGQEDGQQQEEQSEQTEQTQSLEQVRTRDIQEVLQNYSPVTDERLQNPEPENWLMYRRTYNGWGYSPLEQINIENVSNLTPVWTFSTGVIEGHESPPIVNNGVMFITTPQNQVMALNAVTGELLWRFQYDTPNDLTQLHPTNRGVALYQDKVYVGTTDAHLLALDARTGEVVWDTIVEDYQQGYYITLSPLIVHGKVMVGVSGGEFGIRGFVQAFDAETGESVWKTYTIPGEGEPGNETWPGDTWKYGGAPVWIGGHYDPELNLTYWGTGNGAPWIGETRPGANLYTSSTLAIDPDTGELKSYFQYHWNDSWDWDEMVPPIIVDFERNGQTINGLIHVARDSYIWWLEQTADGINFVAAKPYVRQNVFASIDPKTGRPTYNPERKPGMTEPADFCPSLWGGKDWPPIAYSPETHYIYIPVNENLCGTSVGQEVEYRAGQTYTGANTTLYVHDGWDHIGEMQAWDINTGKQVWTHEFERSHMWGPVMATAGGLVFAGGTMDRNFRAFDAKTGEVLWEFTTNSGIIGVPTSFAVDGVQYIAVQSGWGIDAVRMQDAIAEDIGGPWATPVPQGGVVWVFALEGKQGEQERQDQPQDQQQQETEGQQESQ